MTKEQDNNYLRREILEMEKTIMLFREIQSEMIEKLQRHYKKSLIKINYEI